MHVLSHLKASASALALVAALCLQAHPGGAVEIIPSTGAAQPEVRFKIQRATDFEKEVSLRVKHDLDRLPPKRRLEILRRADLTDEYGAAIEPNFAAVDIPHDLVLGSTAGRTEINTITALSGGALEIVASFKDAGGRIIDPPIASIGASRTGGERLCVAEEAPQKAELAVTLLLDQSGSMKDVIQDLKRVATRFIAALPDHGLCRVGAFAETSKFYSPYGGIGECRRRNFSLSGIRASGTTNLYAPLMESYAWLNGQSFAQHQKAAIIVTDGRLNAGLDLEAKLKQMKGDVLTIVYWLGDEDEAQLRGLADYFIRHTGDLKQTLAKHLDVLSTAYSHQKVLRIESCEAAAARRTVQ